MLENIKIGFVACISSKTVIIILYRNNYVYIYFTFQADTIILKLFFPVLVNIIISMVVLYFIIMSII